MMRFVLALGSVGGMSGVKEGVAMGLPRRRQRSRSMAFNEVQTLDWRIRRATWVGFGVVLFCSWRSALLDEGSLRSSAKAIARLTTSQPFFGRPMNF